MRNIIIIIILFQVSNLFAQKSWIFLDTKINNQFKKPSNVIPIADSKTGNLGVFVLQKNYCTSYLYNDNQELISELKNDNSSDVSKNFIGSILSSFKYNLFFTNNSNSKFERIAIDFESKVFKKEEIKLDLKKEYLLGSFEENNQIYLLSVLKDSSILKLYGLDEDGTFNTKTIDLSREVFTKTNGIETSLYHLITVNQNPSRLQSSSIKYNVPISLEMASAINKIYFNNGIVSITNDSNNSNTYLIKINLHDGNYSFNNIEKRGFLKRELRSESNSFVFDDYFFSYYVTTSKLVFSISDLKEKSLVKEYIISDDDKIDFKNTFIKKSKGKFSKSKNPDNCSQFLRNVVNANAGVLVNKKDDVFLITLGGSEKVQSGTFAIVGGILGGLAGAALLSAFDSYSRTESTQIVCMFDESFNHLKGEVPINGFDKINKFITEKGYNNLKLQTIFKYKNSYVWGAYHSLSGTYFFYKFD